MRDILVEDWPGLDEETVDIFMTSGIITLKRFLDLSARKDYQQRLFEAGLDLYRLRALRREARRLIANLPEVVIRGVLKEYFETGTAGVCWAVYEDGKSGYESLHLLETGDYLRVTDETGTVRFEGYIVEDCHKGWREYPANPGYGQPCALGHWIHWTQGGWEPDEWAALFLRQYLLDERKGPPLRAVLTLNKKRS
ncbi:MAG: hypothetical protein AAB554_03845 [Patescibacteria group bacterium]